MVLRQSYPDAASGWQPYQATITQLYRDEGRPLREVMLIMSSVHGFKATEKMYKSRIKLWGLDKKNKCHEVREILRLEARRREKGKRSKFILRNQTVDIANLYRYARRKGLPLDDPASPSATTPPSSTIQDLICFTPPPTPRPIDTPSVLRNVEQFLSSFDAFVRDSLHSGHWRLGKDVMGFACILGVDYPTTVRDQFFLSVERGVRRYNLGDVSQAYRQWRTAFTQLRSVVGSRRPAQLLCLVELIAHLAECKDEVANLLLRYLGDLVNSNPDDPDSRIAMLQSLSRLQANDLTDLARISHDCSRTAFSGHFRRHSFFLLDSETVLTEDSQAARADPVLASPSRLSSLVLGWETYDVEALRAARSVLEILISSERYDEAQTIARIHIQRMHEMPYDGVVGGAFSHAYSYLTHLCLMMQDYENAYTYTNLKVENYFRVLEFRIDLPEDFILSSFSLLSALAKTLGLDDDAEKWAREYAILKRRTDALAENELSALRSGLDPSPENLLSTVGAGDSPSASTPPREAPDASSGFPVEDFRRKCHCHTLARTMQQASAQEQPSISSGLRTHQTAATTPPLDTNPEARPSCCSADTDTTRNMAVPIARHSYSGCDGMQQASAHARSTTTAGTTFDTQHQVEDQQPVEPFTLSRSGMRINRIRKREEMQCAHDRDLARGHEHTCSHQSIPAYRFARRNK